MKSCIVLISGLQGSGKTTLAKNLSAMLADRGHLNKVLKFAGPLYAAHNAVYDIMVERYGWPRPDKPDGTLLQLLGTEWGRKKDPDIWARTAQACVLSWIEQTMARVFIFDDTRFPNEISIMETLKKNNDISLIKVRLFAAECARKERAEKWRDNTQHPSEIALDCYEDWDVVIDTAVIGEMDAAMKVKELVLEKLTEA